MLENNKRIAKNTVLLYLRTFIVLCVSLFTTRLILQALGETDLGIYNVVGGVVILLSFIQSSLTIAVSRFITFELGRDSSSDNMSRIISICLTILLIIGAIIFVISECLGVYIVNKWTVIPDNRMLAANYVFQFALLTFIVQMARVPFDSLVIAHEKMSVYAYYSITETVLKLIVALCLLHCGYDRLIVYAGLLLLVAIIVFMCYFIYVKRTYRDYVLRWKWDKTDSKKILSFSGWSMMGSATNTATQQGVSLLMNNFVGLAANTALGFTNQVVQAVNTFVASFTTAFNPQVIKYCASRELDRMQDLMCRASKFSFVLAYIIALPLIVNMDYVLQLWLGVVPEYTTDFCRLILVCAVIDATTGVFNTAITASGNIKRYQLLISFSFGLDLLIAFILLKLGIYPAIVYASRILTRGFLNMWIGLRISSLEVHFNMRNYTRTVLIPILIVMIISIPLLLIESFFLIGLSKLLFTVLTDVIVVTFMAILVVMNKSERYAFISLVKSHLSHSL